MSAATHTPPKDAAKLKRTSERLKKLAVAGRLVVEANFKTGEITFTEPGAVALVNHCNVLGVTPEEFINRALEAFLNLSPK